MTAAEWNRPVDHERGLTDVPSVIGRGTDEMTDAEVAALYRDEASEDAR